MNFLFVLCFSSHRISLRIIYKPIINKCFFLLLFHLEKYSFLMVLLFYQRIRFLNRLVLSVTKPNRKFRITITLNMPFNQIFLSQNFKSGRNQLYL